MYMEFETQRGELTNAEKLFDLPITGYPNLVEVEKELKSSALVFELYEAQRVSLSIPLLCCKTYTNANTYIVTLVHFVIVHLSVGSFTVRISTFTIIFYENVSN